MSVDVITWVHVPPGSRLEVTVAPNEGAFVSGADLFMADKGLVPIKQWNDAELRPGPAVEQLKDGVDYTLDIRAASVSSAVVNATVSAVLLENASAKVLARQERRFAIQPGSHHLVRIFVDADPILPSEIAPATGPAAPHLPTVRTGRRKKGK